MYGIFIFLKSVYKGNINFKYNCYFGRSFGDKEYIDLVKCFYLCFYILYLNLYLINIYMMIKIILVI